MPRHLAKRGRAFATGAALVASCAFAACATSGDGNSGNFDASGDDAAEAGGDVEVDQSTQDTGAAGDTGSAGDSSTGYDSGQGYDTGVTPDDSGGPVDSGRRDATVDSGRDSGRDSGVDAGKCDGGAVSQPTVGEVLITEVMFDPSTPEPDSEWLEVYNSASKPRRLSGSILKDGGNRTATIATCPDVVLPAGGYALLVRLASAATAAKVPAAAILYEYGAGVPSGSGVQLSNSSSGAIFLMDAAGSTILAESPYGGFGLDTGGHSVQLKNLTFADEKLKASWCKSASAWASGSDDGTPGAVGDCP